MASQREVLKQFLESVKADLISEQADRGITASGESAASLTVSLIGRNGVVLTGADYFLYQVRGRGPGRFPPFEAIKQWIKDKQLRFTNITEDSLAFLIARKIARQGTDIFTGKSAPLPLDAILKQNQEEFDAMFGDLFATEIADEIVKLMFKISTSNFTVKQVQ